MQTHGPQQTASLLDHLVGASEKHRRQGETKRLRGPDIDRKLVVRRGLDGKFGGLLAPEDAADVTRGTAERVDQIGSISMPTFFRGAGATVSAFSVSVLQHRWCSSAELAILTLHPLKLGSNFESLWLTRTSISSGG